MASPSDPLALFITVVGVSELLTGVDFRPAGRRRDSLRLAVEDEIARLFKGRVLPFDHDAAVVYASLMGRSRAAGASFQVADGQIAAIALTRGFAVATRDTAPFAAAGVTVIAPWTA